MILVSVNMTKFLAECSSKEIKRFIEENVLESRKRSPDKQLCLMCTSFGNAVRGFELGIANGPPN